METIARRTAVEYFLLLCRRGSGACPPPPPSSPPPSSSPSREGGFPPPLPRMSSMISSMSSTTVPGMALTSVRGDPKSRVYTKLPHTEPCDENTKRKVGKNWCGGKDSNLHGIATASPSSWCVCQFRHHRKIALRRIRCANVKETPLPDYSPPSASMQQKP